MYNICRTCLKVSNELKNLFEDNILAHKIQVISSVEVSPNDEFPANICELCTQNVHLLYDFRRVIIRSNLILFERQKNSLKCKATDGTLDSHDKPETDIKQCIDAEIIIEDYWSEETVEAPTIKEETVANNVFIDELNVATTEVASAYKAPLLVNPRKRIKIDRNTICSICGVTVRSSNLSKHMLIHNGKPVDCKECGKTCKNVEALRGHMYLHKDIKYECPICHKVYGHRTPFNEHKRRHIVGDVRTVPCDICGKKFFDRKTLKKHVRSHTGERPYPCKFCKKGFSSSHALNTHTRLHTNERPYACKLCSAAFPQNVSLRTHMKSKHPDEVEAPQ